jgi:hypothetical protein
MNRRGALTAAGVTLLLAGCGARVAVDAPAAPSGSGGATSSGGSTSSTGSGAGGGASSGLCTGQEHWTPLGTTAAFQSFGSKWSVTPATAWNGARLFVWAFPNDDPNTGAPYAYDPAQNTWQALEGSGAPSFVGTGGAAWAAARLVVLGQAAASAPMDTAIHDPANGHWTVVSGALKYRSSVIAAGDHVIQWGGVNSTLNVTKKGAILDVASGVWTPTATAGAPSSRAHHSAVWTGATMLVWGGTDVYSAHADGGIYDPAADAWKPIPAVAAMPARSYHGALWTGSRMVVWGGQVEVAGPEGKWPPSGGVYDPEAGTWSAMSEEHAPAGGERPLLLWMGDRMLALVNPAEASGPRAALYDPASDQWTPVTTSGSPFEKDGGFVVSVGASLGCAAVVWGDGPAASGWLYEPPPH